MLIVKRAKHMVYKFSLFYKKYPSATSPNWGGFPPPSWGRRAILGKPDLPESGVTDLL